MKANKIPAPLFNSLQRNFSRDLKIAFEMAQNSTLALVEEAGEKGWTVEELLNRIDELREYDNG